jgi:hypothetical protein
LTSLQEMAMIAMATSSRDMIGNFLILMYGSMEWFSYAVMVWSLYSCFSWS